MFSPLGIRGTLFNSPNASYSPTKSRQNVDSTSPSNVRSCSKPFAKDFYKIKKIYNISNSKINSSIWLLLFNVITYRLKYL